MGQLRIAGHVMLAGDVDEAGAGPRGPLIRRTARDLHGRPVDVAVLPACGCSETDELGSCLEAIGAPSCCPVRVAGRRTWSPRSRLPWRVGKRISERS